MPKLNVQQNNANVIKALRNALAIGQIKGPIASDGADNFSSAGSNPNLLDNPFFTIHQMGTSGHTGIGYGVDRWKIRAGTGCTVTPKTNYGITISYTTTFDITYCFWIPPEMLAGKTYTLSMMINGQVISATGVIGTGNQYYFGISDDTNHIRARVGALSTIGSGNLIINIEPLNASGTISIDAVKLEVGSVSTIANDTPPDYGTELRKCQRYFNRISFASTNYPIAYGYAYSATAVRYLIPLPVTMRTTPTLALTNSFLALGTNAATNAVTAFTSIATFPNGVLVLGTTSNHTVGISLLMTGANATLDLSADL